jgi:hypothetical protein
MNQNIDSKIKECFEYLSRDDVCKFSKKFNEQPHGGEQVMHTFKELILGAFLASNGLSARYDYRINGKTPDWCILGHKLSILGIIELINFHIDKATENSMDCKLAKNMIWCDWVKPNNDRLFQKITEKADRYDEIINRRKLPYVVSITGNIKACLEIEEIHECLFMDHGGLFNLRTGLSGVLFFEESYGGRYTFKYIRNPNASVEIDLPSGDF